MKRILYVVCNGGRGYEGEGYEGEGYEGEEDRIVYLLQAPTEKKLQREFVEAMLRVKTPRASILAAASKYTLLENEAVQLEDLFTAYDTDKPAFKSLTPMAQQFARKTLAKKLREEKRAKKAAASTAGCPDAAPSPSQSPSPAPSSEPATVVEDF